MHAACGRTRGQPGGCAEPLLGQRPTAARPDGIPALQHQRVGDVDRADGLGLRRPRRARCQRDRDGAGGARRAAGVPRRGMARADAGAAGAVPGVRPPGRDGSSGRDRGARRCVVRAGLRVGGDRLRGHHHDASRAQFLAARDLRDHQRADSRQRRFGLGGVGRDLRRPSDQRRPDRLVAPGWRPSGDGRGFRGRSVVRGRVGRRRTASTRHARRGGAVVVADRGARPGGTVAQRSRRRRVRADRHPRHPAGRARSGPARDVRRRTWPAQLRAGHRRDDRRRRHRRADRRQADSPGAGCRSRDGRWGGGPGRALSRTCGGDHPARRLWRGQGVLRRLPPHLRPAPAARPPADRRLRPPGVDDDGRARRRRPDGTPAGDRDESRRGVRGRRCVPAGGGRSRPGGGWPVSTRPPRCRRTGWRCSRGCRC